MACRNTGRARSGWSWRRSVSSAVTGSTIRITVDSLERVDDELLTDRAGLEQERVTRAQFRREGRRGRDGLADELPAGGRIASQREGLGSDEQRVVGTGRHLAFGHEQVYRDLLLVEGHAHEGGGPGDVGPLTREDEVQIQVEGRRRQQRRRHGPRDGGRSGETARDRRAP